MVKLNATVTGAFNRGNVNTCGAFYAEDATLPEGMDDLIGNALSLSAAQVRLTSGQSDEAADLAAFVRP